MAWDGTAGAIGQHGDMNRCGSIKTETGSLTIEIAGSGKITADDLARQAPIGELCGGGGVPCRHGGGQQAESVRNPPGLSQLLRPRRHIRRAGGRRGTEHGAMLAAKERGRNSVPAPDFQCLASDQKRARIPA